MCMILHGAILHNDNLILFFLTLIITLFIHNNIYDNKLFI